MPSSCKQSQQNLEHPRVSGLLNSLDLQFQEVCLMTQMAESINQIPPHPPTPNPLPQTSLFFSCGEHGGIHTEIVIQAVHSSYENIHSRHCGQVTCIHSLTDSVGIYCPPPPPAVCLACCDALGIQWTIDWALQELSSLPTARGEGSSGRDLALYSISIIVNPPVSHCSNFPANT